MSATLQLNDGTVYHGTSFGSKEDVVGEVGMYYSVNYLFQIVSKVANYLLFTHDT